MKRYKLPLATRKRRAELKRERYRSNPDFRLAEINRSRRYQGLAPREALPQNEEIR